MSSGSSCSHVGSASCSASSKRFNWPLIFFRFSLEVPKSFFVRYSICWWRFSFPAGLLPMFFVKTGSVLSVWKWSYSVGWSCPCTQGFLNLLNYQPYVFLLPFSLLLLYHKKQWKEAENPAFTRNFRHDTGWNRSVSVGWHRCLRDHSVGLNAFGCSISSPDISQSNCCQVNCFTSSWFLG